MPVACATWLTHVGSTPPDDVTFWIVSPSVACTGTAATAGGSRRGTAGCGGKIASAKKAETRLTSKPTKPMLSVQTKGRTPLKRLEPDVAGSVTVPIDTAASSHTPP